MKMNNLFLNLNKNNKRKIRKKEEKKDLEDLNENLKFTFSNLKKLNISNQFKI